MALLMQIIRLLRFPNLLIVIATQAVVFFGLMQPTFERNRIQASTGLSEFIQLCGITLLIALGGYMINDIMDTRTDAINKPDKQVVGKHLSVLWAKIWYILLTLSGFGMSLFYAMEQDVMHLLFIYPLAVGLLAFYSYALKRTFLLGNLMVAAFSAFVVAILVIFNEPAMTELKTISPISHTSLQLILIAFMVFAFISSVFREIVKDLEDIEGDKQAGLRTTAVFLGVKRTHHLSIIIGMLLLATLIYWTFHSLNQIDSWLQLFGGLLSIYQLTILYRLWKSTSKTAFHQVSTSIKLLMAAGLLYLFLYSIVI
jgi:4-hydroxybenzoate polyprenyltransferase